MIKISPSKIPKEKLNSAKIRLNTDNINNENKKPLIKSVTNRKGEKSPSSIMKKKLYNFLLNKLLINYIYLLYICIIKLN